MAHFVYLTKDGTYLAGKTTFPRTTTDLRMARVFGNKSAATNAGAQHEKPSHRSSLAPAAGRAVEVAIQIKAHLTCQS